MGKHLTNKEAIEKLIEIVNKEHKGPLMNSQLGSWLRYKIQLEKKGLLEKEIKQLLEEVIPNIFTDDLENTIESTIRNGSKYIIKNELIDYIESEQITMLNSLGIKMLDDIYNTYIGFSDRKQILKEITGVSVWSNYVARTSNNCIKSKRLVKYLNSRLKQHPYWKYADLIASTFGITESINSTTDQYIRNLIKNEQKILDQLSPGYQLLLKERFYKRKTFKQISEEFRCSKKGLTARQHKLIIQLRNTELNKYILNSDVETIEEKDPLADLKLSTRAYNILKRKGLDTVEKIEDYAKKNHGLMNIRYMGNKASDEIVTALYNMGINIKQYDSRYVSKLTIDSFGLSTRVVKALHRYGIINVEDLLRAEKQGVKFSKIQGLGSKSCKEIKEFIEKYNQ